MPIDAKYAGWIETDMAAHNNWARGRCQNASRRMTEAFPELRLVRGYCVLANGYAPAHWWCETDAGVVIDPTAAQFDVIVDYDEYNEEKHGPLPIGKCMNCGFEVFNHDHQGLCSVECLKEFTAYVEQLDLLYDV